MLLKQGQVLVCKNCGTEVQVLREAYAELACCGQPMVVVQPKSR